ncbi:MAG: hypothetical protein AAFO58_04180 [Pseudomonadota bacterium]
MSPYGNPATAKVISFTPTILFVDDMTNLSQERLELGGQHVPVHAAFRDISPHLLSEVQPDTVVSPLCGPGFDAADLASLLQEAGFRGRYRAVTRAIPKPWVVLREVRSLAPELNFDIWVVDHA